MTDDSDARGERIVDLIVRAGSENDQRLPDRYRADTLILVVPQRVPDAYVKATVTTTVEDRLQSTSQQILSRTRLERLILDLNLYPQERKTWIMQDIVERMQSGEKARPSEGAWPAPPSAPGPRS